MKVRTYMKHDSGGNTREKFRSINSYEYRDHGLTFDSTESRSLGIHMPTSNGTRVEWSDRQALGPGHGSRGTELHAGATHSYHQLFDR
jgi:hypothetical protein